MKAKQWLQVATIASSLALAGTALANDRDQISKKEQAGAAVNSNTPAQLGTGLNRNSAAQLGTDTPKATVPNDSEAAEEANAPKQHTDVDTSKQKMKHPPTAQMDKATPTQKTPSDKPAAKHPPTNAMDKATPDEKSPNSSQ